MELNGKPLPKDPGDSTRGSSRWLRRDRQDDMIRKMSILIFLMLLIPVVSSALIFPALQSQPFEKLEDIDPAQVKWIRVQILNRSELDGGEDLFPFYADPSDYPKLLEALKELKPVDQFEGIKGPWLGDYRVMLQNGRRATLKLYWYRPPQAAPGSPALLRLQIDEGFKYEGGTVTAVLAAATEAATRGRKQP